MNKICKKCGRILMSGLSSCECDYDHADTRNEDENSSNFSIDWTSGNDSSSSSNDSSSFDGGSGGDSGGGGSSSDW